MAHRFKESPKYLFRCFKISRQNPYFLLKLIPRVVHSLKEPLPSILRFNVSSFFYHCPLSLIIGTRWNIEIGMMEDSASTFPPLKWVNSSMIKGSQVQYHRVLNKSHIC